MTARTIYEQNGVTTNDTAIRSSYEIADDFEIDSIIIVIPKTFTVETGDIVTFKSGTGYDIFEGICQKVLPTGSNKEITIYSYEQEMNQDIVETTYTSQAFNTIANSLVTTYSSLTFVNATAQDPTIEEFTSKNKTPWQILKNLMQRLINVTYHVNFSTKVLTIFERGQYTVPVSLINADNCWIPNEWEEDISSQTTELKLVGNKQVRKDFQDIFDGDASTASFVLTEIPINLKVFVGGVEQELQTENTSAGDYVYSKETKTITFQSGSIPGSGTGNIVCTYDFELNLKVNMKADPAIITKYGTKQTKMTKTFLNNYDVMNEFAVNYLSRFGEPLLRNEVQYYKSFDVSSFIPGYFVNVQDSVNPYQGVAINDFFIVNKVTRRMPEGQIIFEVGDKKLSILNYLKELDDTVTQLTETDDNAQIELESQFLTNKVQIDIVSQLTLQLERTLPDNFLYFGNEIDGLQAWYKLDGDTNDYIGDNHGTVSGFTNEVGWWKGDGDATDSSSSGNDGTWSGTEAYDTGKQFTNAFDFDGSSYIDNSSSTVGSEGTISIWLKAGTQNSENIYPLAFYSKHALLGPNGGGTRRVGLITYNGSTNIYYDWASETSLDPYDGDWHLYTVSWDSTYVYCWVDNISCGNPKAHSGNIYSGTQNLLIGAWSSSYGNHTGLINDVRIFPRVLSDSERTRIYNEGLGLTTELTSYDTGKQFNEAFDFNGSNYVNVSDILNVDSDFTITGWVYRDNSEDMFFLDFTPSSNNRFWFRIVSNDFNCSIYDGTNTYGKEFNTSFNTEEWYFFTAINNSTTNSLDFYINTTVANIDYYRGAPINSDSRIGNDCTGKMQDVRIFNRVLTLDERTSIYNSGLGLTGNTNIAKIGNGEDRVFSEEITGLIGWWKLNGDANDSSDNSNDGTWSGTESYDVGKQFDLAGDFDGSSYIQATNPFQSNVTTDVTVSFWFKINTLSTNNNIFYRLFGNSLYPRAWVRTDGQLQLQLRRNGSTNGIATATGEISTDTWYHVVYNMHSNGDLNGYVNNIDIIETKTLGGTYWNGGTSNLRLGYDDNIGYYMDGQIADFRLYNKILSENERTAIYNAGVGLRYNTYNELSDGTLGTSYILCNQNNWNSNPDNELPDLVAYYPLDGDSTDASGNGYDGTDTDITYTIGKVGQCASFNGSTSKINFTADNGIITGSGDFTIMFWMKSSSSNDMILQQRDIDATDGQYWVKLTSGGKINYADYDTGYGFNNYTQSTINDDTWHHIGIKRVASETRLYFYVDGEIDSIHDGTIINLLQARDFAIGYDHRDNNTYYAGLLDDVVIVSRALTTDEVKARYNEGSGKTDKYQSWETIQ